MIESIRRVTGKISINKTLHCLTLAKGSIEMIKEKTEVTNRYELIDKDGNRHGSFPNMATAAAWAHGNLRDQKQDDSGPNEEPNGWYLEWVRPLKSLAD